MFCKNCGKEIAENAAFCVNCGAQLNQAPVEETVANQPVATAAPESPIQQPVTAAAPEAPVQQPVAPNPVAQPVAATTPSPFAVLMTDTIDLFKGMLTNNAIKTLTNAAQSKKLTWLVIFAFNFIVQIISNLISVFASSSLSALNSLSSAFLGSGTSGPLFFGLTITSLVSTAALLFGISLSVWVLVNKVFKKTANFTCVLNLVATCAIPLVAVNAANIIISLIFTPLSVALYVAAIVAFFSTLYVGIQKLNKLDKSPYFGYIIMIAIITFVVVFPCWIVINAIMSTAMGALGGLSSLF